MYCRYVLLFLVFSLHGCESGQEASLSNVDTVTETVTGTPVAMAVEDLSARTGVPPHEVQLISEKTVTWPDGSLGCPKEGMMYTQAQVEGMQIVLEVNGKRYAYHSGNGRQPFLCENPHKPASRPSPD